MPTFNIGTPAQGVIEPPSVTVPANDSSPVDRIDARSLQALGQHMWRIFMQYISDRRIAELRWLRNQRQYLGIYDPEIEKELNVNRSKAYPRITRVKCISVVSRLMNLMFQGNERNWELKAAPWPDITLQETQEAIQQAQEADQKAGAQVEMDLDYAMRAIQDYANRRACKLSDLIDDQLQELGGDQTLDYVALNRKVLQSGVQYGLGVLRGPFVRKSETVDWKMDTRTGVPKPKKKVFYKPLFEFLPVWDFYPDLAAKTMHSMDGYFVRHVMSRHQVSKLMSREGFFADIIRKFLNTHPQGNYRPQPFETELRAMGVKVNVNEMKWETLKYEIIVWHGPVSGEYLRLAGVEVEDSKLADDLDAEVWLMEGNVIRCALNPWAELEVDMTMIHAFLYDEDDTSPIGFGLPNAIRDSQMAVAAATRMLMDNASVVCGPNIEINTDLLRPDQDLRAVAAYKIWYREGEGVDAQWPAVRNVQIDAHLDSLLKIIELFLKFADSETFVGPSTGGDMSQAPSEPLRTAAGASMLRGDAALPFKDMIRAFDRFTQSVIQSLVIFNRKFNPELAPDGDYDVIARGATSLIAKELRGAQADQLAMTLKPEEMVHVDERKLVLARLKARDMDDILVTEAQARQRQQAQDQQAQQAQQMQERELEATVRKLLSDAYKNITQGQKNAANADATTVQAALDLLERGMANVLQGSGMGAAALPQPADGGGNGGDDQLAGAAQPAPGASQGPAGAMPGGGVPLPSG
jgi:hypothetical protein